MFQHTWPGAPLLPCTQPEPPSSPWPPSAGGTPSPCTSLLAGGAGHLSLVSRSGWLVTRVTSPQGRLTSSRRQVSSTLGRGCYSCPCLTCTLPSLSSPVLYLPLPHLYFTCPCLTCTSPAPASSLLHLYFTCPCLTSASPAPASPLLHLPLPHLYYTCPCLTCTAGPWPRKERCSWWPPAPSWCSPPSACREVQGEAETC